MVGLGSLPKRTGDVRADAIRELRWAMRGAGLTLDKLPAMTAVLALPVVARAVAGAATEVAEKAAYDAISGAAFALGESPQARLLRCALAIGYAGSAPDLTGRRAEFTNAHNVRVRADGRRDYLPETARALYSAEQAKLEELVTALGAGVIRRSSDAPRGVPRKYTCIECDVTYRLRGRMGDESEFLYVFRSDADGFDRFNLSYFTETPGGALAELVVREGGYVVARELRGEPAAQIDTIAFPRAVAAGEQHRVRIDVSYPPGTVDDTFSVLSILRPTERLVTRVHFDPPDLPGRVWRVDRVFPNAGVGDARSSEPLRPDLLGCVEACFVSPDIGYTYGVAWAW